MPERQVCIRFDELDDVVDVAVSHDLQDALISIEAERSGDRLTPVLTDVEFSRTDDSKNVEVSAAEFKLERDLYRRRNKGGSTRLNGRLWNSLKWDLAFAPYVRADWALSMRFTSDDVWTALVLDIPREYGPASLRGNHVLAHPSQRDGERRLVRLQYPPGTDVHLQGRVTRLGVSPSVWLSLARGASLLVYGLLLGAIGTKGLAGQQVELLLSALAGIGLFGARENAAKSSTIYRAEQQRLHQCQMISATVSAVLFLCVSIRIVSGHPLGDPLVAAVCIVASAQVLIAALGYVLHRSGHWAGYLCDMCGDPLGIRVGQRECYITGRVPCDKDVANVCSGCPHVSDLGSSTPLTLGRYDVLTLPCAVLGAVDVGKDVESPRP